MTTRSPSSRPPFGALSPSTSQFAFLFVSSPFTLFFFSSPPFFFGSNHGLTRGSAWSLATGSLPQCSCFPHLPPKPGIIDDIEASLWIPYTDDGKSSPSRCRRGAHAPLSARGRFPAQMTYAHAAGAPLQRSCEQPSNVRSVYKCFCELSELVHQSLSILHSPGRPLTSRDLLNIYTQYLNWYDRITVFFW